MSRGLAASAALFLVCACVTESASSQPSGSPPATTADAKPTAKRPEICENEAPLGSHLATRRCRSAEQADQERLRVQEEMLRARASEPIRGGN
jgi:hypothetical protein